MNYEQKYFDEIFENMLNNSLEKGLISHAEDFKSFIANQDDISNYYVMDKSVIADMFATAYEDMTLGFNKINIQIAEEEDLDNIGDILGIPRPPATSASALVTFVLKNNETEEHDITIPSGIIISTDSGIEYYTVDDLYFPTGETTATVQSYSVEAGTEYKVIENTLTNITSETEYVMECYNENPSSGGTDEYSDEEYRTLLLTWREVYLKGSTEAYEEFFANFEGIDGYHLVPNWDGTGTMKIIVDPGTPEILNATYETIQNSVTQATEDIVMFAPIEKYINIYAVVNVDIDQINPYSDVEKSEIQSRIITAIKTFIDGGYRLNESYYSGLNIGEDFIPHKLAVFLDEEIPELKNINFNYPETHIEITDEEQGKSNEITIEMV